MAVESTNKTIGDFRRYYQKFSSRLFIASQILVALGVGCLLLLMNMVVIDSLEFWAIIIGVLAFSSVICFIFMRTISEPLYDIMAAMMHKTNELTVTTPPNPNAKHNLQSGFKSLLEIIYAGSLNSPLSTNAPVAEIQPDQTNIFDQAFAHTSCGIVIFDENKQIIKCNAVAPVSSEQTNTPFLALNFINEISVLDWIKEAEDQSISAERRWDRVGTDPRYIKQQQFYDIVASYEKGSKAETVVFLINQSEKYLPEEEDLNFLAFAAHELRGPTTIIRGYLDVLEKELSERLRGDELELFQRLTVSANRLSSYINNILNVAKLDRHHLRVYLYEDTVQNIYNSIAYDMDLRAKSQHRLLSVNIPADLPTIAADKSSIGEVLGNLIDNAIKYSFEGGSVLISAEAKGEFVEISVSDNGIGMPPSIVNNLFKKFYRSHRSRDSVAGSGIGLYICKAFIESHGGSLIVRSQEGAGSTFTFTLPIYSTVADKLLEDNQSNQSLIRQGGGWIKNHSMYRE